MSESEYGDPFEGMESEKDVESEKSETKPKRIPRKKGVFDESIKNVSRKDAAKATGKGASTMHGEYYQLTTRLPMEVVEEIREWASDLGMTQQDLQRYCFYRGLQSLNDGERPEFEEVVIRRKLKSPNK